ncbi:MAG: response regulator [Opitutaceae bacterium]
MDSFYQDTRILVVDDEKLLTRIVEKDLIAEGGVSVCVENDSKLALEKAIEFKPDVVLLDIVMPDLDGHAVAEALRNHPETAAIPILHISAMIGDRGDLGKFFKTEDGYFLTKPFGRRDLLSAIDSTLADSLS